MNNSNVSISFEHLIKSSNERWTLSNTGKTQRIIVQTGQCSLAVGATQVTEILKDLVSNDSKITTAGCDGTCFNAPQAIVVDSSGRKHRLTNIAPEDVSTISKFLNKIDSSSQYAFNDGQRRLTMDQCGELDSTDIDDYINNGGYKGLAKALMIPPASVIAEAKSSGLRGRGGAYFPAALKWERTRSFKDNSCQLIVNAEEGEPGIFKDRHLMEGVPHRIIEGMIIAAYAANAEKAHIYINAEADLSAKRMRTAVTQAYEHGLLGDNILSSGYNLHVTISRGAGGYVCGEETTLINTMEGYRREPRLKPPFPTDSGLWGKPTVINNPETLANIPFIMSHGASTYSEIGTEEHKGTKIVSLTGSVLRPGIVEVPMGTTLRQIIYDLGGGPTPGQTLKAVAVGGPSSGILPISEIDTPIKPGFLHESGVMLGSGGIIALNDDTPLLSIVRKLAFYNASESCGKCTPCREGTPRIVETLDKLQSGAEHTSDLENLQYLAQVVNNTSLCGLGQAAGNPILSAIHFFREELYA